MEKRFKMDSSQILNLISNIGSCIASDKITVDGLHVGYMYREEPAFENDSGWRFFSGTETQEYIDDENNSMIYDVNTIANYDKSIIPYLNSPIGMEFEKQNNSSDFVGNDLK